MHPVQTAVTGAGSNSRLAFRAAVRSILLAAITIALFPALQSVEPGREGLVSPTSTSRPAGSANLRPAGGEAGKHRLPRPLPPGLSPGDWQAIRAAHTLARYNVERTAEGWQAWNPGQQWLTTFDHRGFLIREERGDRPAANWTWGLELTGYGFGDALTTVRGRPDDIQTAGGELRYLWQDRAGRRLTEWYRNEEKGFEHGFTITDRPGQARRASQEARDERLNLILKVRGNLFPDPAGDGQAIAFRRSDGEVAVNYSGLKVWDASGRELPATFAVAGENQIRMSIDEYGAAYPLTVDPTAHRSYFKASVHSQAGEEFGTAVAISGDTVVVGAPSDDSETRGINQPPSYTYSYDDSGTVFVFVRSGSTWTQQAHLKSFNSWTADRFGAAVAIEGDTIVVGAPGESQTTDGVDGDQCLPPSSNPCGRSNSFPVLTGPDVGAAYVFVRNGTTWTQQNYLKASNSEDGDSFGYAVAIHDQTIVVGAHYEDSAASLDGDQNDNSALEAGAAYVFFRSGATWIQQAYLKAANAVANDQFGYAVAIHNDTAVIGAVLQGDGAPLSGAAYVFRRTGSTWSQQAQLKSPNPVTSDYFGGAVAVYDDRLVIGALGEDTGGADSGAAYVFKRTGTAWSQEAWLKASDTDPDDNFGYAVTIQGEVVMVGASNENGTAEGGVYVFFRQAANWVEAAILRGGNTEAFDRFGSAIGFSGETVVIGARYEESDATGIDGDGANNLQTQTGAAYTFLVEPLRITGSVVTNTRQAAPGSVATIYITVTNPDSVSRTGTLSFTVPAGLILIPGSCDAAGGNCSFTQEPTTASPRPGAGGLRGRAGSTVATVGNWVVGWTGLVPGSSSLVISFQVQIGNQATSGSQVCISTPAPGSSGNICVTVSAPPSGPGLPLPFDSAASSKPASVLVYNLYTSGVNPATNDTRLTISNTSQVNPVNVHLFFVDGASCAVADQFVRLTQNQTLSMLASDVDPGVTGYVVAVATDDRGCPISQNDLIGESFIRFERGHSANLTAMGIAALPGGLPACTASSSTATLFFDGVSYNALPRTMAVDSLPSRANLNETLLVVNRLGGDLTSGATRLDSLAGVLFDDVEMAQSFTLPAGSCQLIGMLGNNFPRTAPRYDSVIPAGRTGWLKLYQVAEGAISGAVINHSADGFSGGHNLHALTTTTTASFTIPVFPAR